MTDDIQPKSTWFPTSRLWTVLFAVSLAANLLVVGMAIGFRNFSPPNRGGYMQLIPRKFFMELPKDRRRALLDQLRPEMDNLRDLADATSLQIADALEKQPFDVAALQEAVAPFATGEMSLAVRGPLIIKSLAETLTPDERTRLAAAIRQEQAHRKKRK